MSSRYTAILYSHDQELYHETGNTLNKLTILLLSRLELVDSGAEGNIIDNNNGRIVQRCRRKIVK